MTSSTRSAIGFGLPASSFEDRQLLLGHKATHVTTHYSAADIGNLIAASEKVCELASRKSPAVAIVRARGSAMLDGEMEREGVVLAEPELRDPCVQPCSQSLYCAPPR